MGIGTGIEWTDVSWPVVNGCRRISTGCENCYSERLTATRLSKTPKYRGLAIMTPGGPRYTGVTRLWDRDLDLPLRRKKPSRIFVANMGDLFYDKVSDRDIQAVFGVMATAGQHTFQVLTKRPERMLEWMKKTSHEECVAELCHRDVKFDSPKLRRNRIASMPAGWPWPLPNVWLGVSAENQETADERIPLLLETPAAVRFVSAEPLLGPINFRNTAGRDGLWKKPAGLDWIIVGGESGPGARPYDLVWARSIIEQCQKTRVAVFHKQIGACPVDSEQPSVILVTKSKKGGDMAEWPPELRVRHFPKAAA